MATDTDSVHQLVSEAIDLTGEDGEDEFGGANSNTPLPGFDPRTSCQLCRLYTRDTGPVGNSPDSNLDDSLLAELVRMFHQVNLTSRPHLIKGYTRKFCELGRRNPNLAFLVDITDEEVWKHYDEDHDETAHQYRDSMREIERTLEAVLHQAPMTLCVELKKGPNKGKRVVHPQRLRSYLETVKTYTQLPRTNKQ